MSLGSFLPRLGLVAAAALVGLSTAVGAAAAEPTESAPTETPATPTTTPEEPPTGTPTSDPTSEPPAGEPSTPPSGPPSLPADPSAEPESEVTPKRLTSLEVLVDFDKESYRTGETMSIRFEVVNLLPEVARDISASLHFTEPDAIQTDYESWGLLNEGVDIPAGGTFSVTVTGRVGVPGATTGVLGGYLYDETGFSVVEFRHSVPITPTFGRAAGIVYADENGNARLDAGEGLPGVVVTAANQVRYEDSYTATTAADGTFSFPRLPTVRMQLSATAPDGWLIGYQFVTIDESDSNDNLRLRAVRPLTSLTVSLAFEKDTYRVGEPAKVRVRLTNTGDRDLVGIVANCNRVGNSNNLTGRTAGWGDLAGDGVTVRANRTLALTVTEAVPRAAFDYGTVHVGCDFSYPYVDDPGNPSDYDSARVPGGFGTIEGIVGHFANGYDQPPVGVGDVRLVLATDGRCPRVAETRSDADGRFAFRKIPAGEYELYLLPPEGWQAAYENPSALSVRANQTSDLVPQVTRGDAAPPKLPAQPPGCDAPAGTLPPQAQGRAAPDTGLADTGASVVGLVVVGLGALVTGAGGVVSARRRSGTKVTIGSR